MRKALLVAYYYPPYSIIGSMRPQKFARYLPEFGWQPIVLTSHLDAYPSPILDAALDTGESSGVQVARTGAINLNILGNRGGSAEPAIGNAAKSETNDASSALSRASARDRLRHWVRTWIYIPDGQIGWYPHATRAGSQIIRRENVDVIYSTSSPATSHLIAYKLKRKTKRPWVADFRDLWTENHTSNSKAIYESKLRRRIDQRMESRMLAEADAIVTVSNALADTLRKITQGKVRVEVIRNGFDAADFDGIQYTRPDRWTISHVGSFYDFYNTEPILQALRRLIERGKIDRSNVLFNIVGRPAPHVVDIARRLGIADIVDCTGYVTHREALTQQVNSSLLLLFLHRDPSNTGIVTGKLFEYLGARRSILVMGSSGFEAAQIVRDSKAGDVVDGDDAAAIEQVLLHSYQSHLAGRDVQVPVANLAPYERRHGAAQLAALFDEICAR